VQRATANDNDNDNDNNNGDDQTDQTTTNAEHQQPPERSLVTKLQSVQIITQLHTLQIRLLATPWNGSLK